MTLQKPFELGKAPHPWPELGPQISEVLKVVAAEPLTPEANKQPAGISMAAIRNFVCKEYRVTPERLIGSGREKHLIEPRHIAMALCKRMTECSLQQIGMAFHRDHTAVLHAIHKCNADPALFERTNILERRILGGGA